jgi:hypothetical protein
VNVSIFPTIAQIGLERVEDDDPVFLEQGQCLGTLAVVFVDLWQTMGEFEVTIEQTVVGRQLDEVLARVDLFHLAAERLIHAVVVVCVKKPTRI